jgi:hypothetical protein
VDDRAMRVVAAISDPVERGRAFDALRSSYRTRRELRGSTIRPGNAVSRELRCLLSALGVRIDDADHELRDRS